MNFFPNVTNLTYTEEPSRIHDIENYSTINSKSILQAFPTVSLNQPSCGFSETNAYFESSNSCDFDKKLINKHQLPLYESTSDILNQTESTTYAAHGSIIDKQPIFRRLLSAFFHNGLIGLCETVTQYQPNQQVPPLVKKIAKNLIKIIDTLNAPANPWILSSKETEFNLWTIKGKDWKNNVVRAFQWHPHSSKYAVAFKNDIVKIYSNNQPHVVLKHHSQQNITCLAWKPFYNSIIAVGCANCIIIWDTESSSVLLKPASSCSFILSKRYHNDIMDLQWYPKSDFLLSVASRDNQILIWDTMLKTCVPIKRIGNVGFSLARFSPSGFSLFTADLSTSFRIWKPVDYSSEKWINLHSRCSSASWSPDGSILLFTCEDCSLLYSLKFLPNGKQELDVVCDMSTISLNQNEISHLDQSILNRNSIGGYINDICWDLTGQRLAVSFKSKNLAMGHLNVVALFSTKFQPQLQVFPSGFISDVENSWPVAINFKPEFEPGALLTIVWSNGRIQHVPFYFNRIVDDYGKHETITNK
ncbi:aladin isoform X1 [Brachionus plicatilis]|uniref:Aladin isoform X1 n=1 Tax=Brachionus plicatilis TaxID=10195 RepID=A0A3M7T502_BRAPC|nr:aladin isoform X1 [Brachionus plicatilis]